MAFLALRLGSGALVEPPADRAQRRAPDVGRRSRGGPVSGAGVCGVSSRHWWPRRRAKQGSCASARSGSCCLSYSASRVLAGDRIGERPLILGVCAAGLGGVVLMAVGGAAASSIPAFALVAVAGSFLQFAPTRAGVLVSAHETRGLGPDEQLSGSRRLRRWFEPGMYLRRSRPAPRPPTSVG